MALNEYVDLVAVLHENGVAVYRFSGGTCWSVRVDGEWIRWSADGKVILAIVSDLIGKLLLIMLRCGKINAHSREDGQRVERLEVPNLVNCTKEICVLETEESVVLWCSTNSKVLHEFNGFKFSAMHRDILLVVKENVSMLYRITEMTETGSVSSQSPNVLNSIKEDIGLLNDCHVQLISKFFDFGLEKIIEIYTKGDPTLFKELVEFGSSFNLRFLESKYHTFHSNVIASLHSIRHSDLQAHTRELRRLLSVHQERWDEHQLWLRTLQTIGNSEDATVEKWQIKCRSSKMALFIDLCKGGDTLKGELERILSLARVIIDEPHSSIDLSLITQIPHRCKDFNVEDDNIVLLLFEGGLVRIDLNNPNHHPEASPCPHAGSKLLNLNQLYYVEGSFIQAMDISSLALSTLLQLELPPSDVQISATRKTMAVLSESPSCLKIFAL